MVKGSRQEERERERIKLGSGKNNLTVGVGGLRVGGGDLKNVPSTDTYTEASHDQLLPSLFLLYTPYPTSFRNM